MRIFIIVCCLGLVGCPSKPATDAPATTDVPETTGAPAPPAAEPAAATAGNKHECESDDGCVLTTLNSCCDSCDEQAVSTTWLAELEAKCATKEVDCPDLRCSESPPKRAACVDGKCTAVDATAGD